MNLALSHLRLPRLLAPLLLALSLVGCAVSLIAPYDDTTDRLLTDLTVRTQTAVAQADAGQLSEAAREEFYATAEGTVKTMEMRASLYAKNDDEIATLAALAERYHKLHASHVNPRTSLTTGLRATLLDLQQIQLAKKRSTAFSSGLKQSAAKP
jgi:hypothetical protein